MTGNVLKQLAKAMFPFGFIRNDDETGEFIIHTGLKYHPNEDLEDGPLVRVSESTELLDELLDGDEDCEPIDGITIMLQRAQDVADEHVGPGK